MCINYITSEIQSETPLKKGETGNIHLYPFVLDVTAPGITSMQKQSHNISRHVR